MVNLQRISAGAGLGLVILVSFFLNLGGIPLFDLDEGAFSEATREMFVRGDFMSTYLNGVPRHDKPILIYWLQAASVALFGINEFAFRLPSALAATGWVLMIYYFVARLTDGRRALLAAVVTATCLEISVMGKAATADALLNFCITSAMLMYFLHYRFRRRRYHYLFFLFMGLGFLTKGPIAIIIPAVVTTLFALLRGEWAFWARTVFDPRAIALFAVVALPWYIAQYFRDGGAFIKAFFFEHNVGRFDQAMESHRGSFFYYVPVVLLGVLPYTAAALLVFKRFPRLVRDDLSLYLLLWFGFVFLLFSFSGTKLPHYVVYGFSALTILMALNMDGLRRRWLSLLPVQLFLLVLLFLPQLLDYAQSSARDVYLREMLANHWQVWPVSYFLWVVLALVAVGYLTFEKRLSLVASLCLSGVITVATFSSAVMPVVATLQQQPIKEAAQLARQQGLEVVQWHLRTPSFNVYSESISPQREPRPGDYVLTKTKFLADLPTPYETLYRKHGITLIYLRQTDT